MKPKPTIFIFKRVLIDVKKNANNIVRVYIKNFFNYLIKVTFPLSV